MSHEELRYELSKGGRFVVYMYCVSVLIMTFKRSSGIHFVKGDEKDWKNILLYSLISLIFGWWGIPWGPIYTFTTVFTNVRGGKDVTADILNPIDFAR